MIDLSDILNVEKNEIFIPEEKWTFLKNNYEKEEIKKAISDAIDLYEIPMPLRKLDEFQAISDFKELIMLDTHTMLNDIKDIVDFDEDEDNGIYSRYDYKYKFSDYYINQSKIGNMSSDYFQQYNRYLCDSINAPSPYRSWFNPVFRNGLLNALFTLKYKEINMGSLRSAIGLRKYIASQFKPSVAKFLYDLFKAKNVLDFSSGWGDRLAGFYSSENTVSYTGIDPNKIVFETYKKQIELYSKYKTKEVNIINSPAEDVDFKNLNKKFDFIFTSPPYFNIERYTQEKNQSWQRYKKLDIWLESFLFKTLSNSWECLEDGGILAVNISDVYSGHKINKICDPMNDFISSLPNSFYMGCMGMKMSKRPNSKSSKKSGVFVEPIWFFSKNRKITLDEYIKNIY